MSDDSDDAQLYNFPVPGEVLDRPPELADPSRLFPAGSDGGESEEPDAEESESRDLSSFAAPDPAMALRPDGVAAPENGEGEEEYEDGESTQPRSLADRLGDWLELRLEMARARHESEAPFREAEIARKVGLLEARTAREVAMMEQNGKLHAAMMKAKGGKAAARGKADTDRMRSPGSGLGTDKGRSKASGGSSRGGGGTGASRDSSGKGPERPDAPRGPNSGGAGGRSGSGTPGGGRGGKGGAKGPDRSSGGRGAGSGRDGSSGGSKGSQAGSGGSGKNGDGSGGGNAKSGGGRKGHDPDSRARDERERRRDKRRAAEHAAGLADRSKDRDQARARRQTEWEDRRAKRRTREKEREAERKGRREAAASADSGRTALGQALTEEARRRWEARRAETADGTDAEKAGLSKEEEGKGKKTGGAASDEPGARSKTDDEASEGPSKGWEWFKRRREARKDRFAGATATGGETGRGPFGEPAPPPTTEWPGRHSHPPQPEEEDYPDAEIVEDGPPRRPGPAGTTSDRAALPAASEPHTPRPGPFPDDGPGPGGGSSPHHSPQAGDPAPPSPASKEHRVSQHLATPSTGLAAQHRTDITFGEYLVEMANIAIAAGMDKEESDRLADVLGRVADALRDMATDLAEDHNLSPQVTDAIAGLGDAAVQMRLRAERCAQACETAHQAALVGAAEVGRVYGQDMRAVDDAGLTQASAAAHHD